MKTNLIKSGLVSVPGTLLTFLEVLAISLQLGARVSLAQQLGVGSRLLIPSAAYSDTFTSSLVVQNVTLGANTLIISAYDTGGNPLGTPLTTTLLFGRQFRSSNILKELGAPLGSFGPIRIESKNNGLLSAGSEVRSSQGFGGFFPGQNVNTVPLTSGSPWTSGIILDVVDDGSRGTPATYRTNLGLNTVGPQSAQVAISLVNDVGELVGKFSTAVAGNGLTQLDGIVQRLRGSAAVTRGSLRISSSQPIIAWASKIDNGTDDPSFQIGVEATHFLSGCLSLSSLSTDVAQDLLQRVYDWDWKGAENTMRRALELDPNNVDAHYNSAVLLMAQGRFPDALSEIQTAEQLDPLSQQVQSTFGKILFNAGKSEEAILRLKRAIERNPRNAQAHTYLAQIYEQMGKYSEALAIHDKARGLRGNPPDNPRFLAIQARLYARMGKRSEAKRVLPGIKTLPAAAAHAHLGEKDESFRLLSRMVEERHPQVFSLMSDPQFNGLHSDPRWPELLRRMNLPTQ
ncbi:MAG: tetratricopeptide repeat protein [Acidobacteria bacterium]|nr:tetratricopeptide repeat protein [Acidobacteriota bacterium]MCI0724707.1 tetratricopeptide repeat protein [Acidobacteriota bacterium]